GIHHRPRLDADCPRHARAHLEPSVLRARGERRGIHRRSRDGLVDYRRRAARRRYGGLHGQPRQAPRPRRSHLLPGARPGGGAAAATGARNDRPPPPARAADPEAARRRPARDRRAGRANVQGPRRRAPPCCGAIGQGASHRSGTPRPGRPFGGGMDDPHLIERRSTADRLRPAPARERPLARVQALPWLLFIVALALAVWFGWRAFGPQDNGDPLATSLVAFEKQNRLTVFSAQLSPVVSSEDSRLFGAIRSRQVAVIPARVDYTLDLSQMDASRLRWDEAASTLDVQLPPLRVSRPNLDEGRAQYLREGIWITRDAQDNLTRQNTRLAEQQAVEQAANPVLLSLARSAAKDAIRQNLAIPLEVAGFGRVTVNVRFDGEAVPARQGAPQGSQSSQ